MKGQRKLLWETPWGKLGSKHMNVREDMPGRENTVWKGPEEGEGWCFEEQRGGWYGWSRVVAGQRCGRQE